MASWVGARLIRRPFLSTIVSCVNRRIADILWAYKQHGSALLRDVAHLAQAFLLELRVAHRQDLVDHKDLGLQVGSDRKCQPQVHAG